MRRKRKRWKSRRTKNPRNQWKRASKPQWRKRISDVPMHKENRADGICAQIIIKVMQNNLNGPKGLIFFWLYGEICSWHSQIVMHFSSQCIMLCFCKINFIFRYGNLIETIKPLRFLCHFFFAIMTASKTHSLPDATETIEYCRVRSTGDSTIN